MISAFYGDFEEKQVKTLKIHVPVYGAGNTNCKHRKSRPTLNLISTISTPPPPLGGEIKSMYTVLKNIYFTLMTLEKTGGSRF